MDIYLTAGSHTISLAKNTASGSAVLDCIDLGFLAPAQNVVQEPSRRYEAEYASLGSGFRVRRDASNLSGTGFVESSGTGTDAVTFVVETARDGFYNIRLRYTIQGGNSLSAQLLINGSARDTATLGRNSQDSGFQGWIDAAQDIFLAAGVNRIGFQISASATVKIDCLDVTPLNGDTGKTMIDAAASPQNTLSGTAVVTSDPYAYQGS